jgi:hypothetical protein
VKTLPASLCKSTDCLAVITAASGATPSVFFVDSEACGIISVLSEGSSIS